jgi:hypothetical protein
MRLVLFCLFMIFGLSSAVNAAGIMCYDRNVNAVLSAFKKPQRENAENYFKPYVKITDEYVQFGLAKNRWYKARLNQGDSYSTAKVDYGQSLLKFKYNKKSQTLVVTKASSGYVIPPPLTYRTCEKLGSSSSVKQAENKEASLFNRLSICDRRYIQQFLKGQGLYSNKIDGKWGANTYIALVNVSKTGKLKFKSVSEIIEVLANNVVCD